MHRVFTLVAWAYLLAAIYAVILGLATIWGWFGIRPDALGMLFAALAAVPWSFGLALLPHGNLGLGLVLILAGIGINAAGLFVLAHAMRR